MATNDDCCSTQVIDGNGTFNVSGLEQFMNKVKFHQCGLSYRVLSIMGPQSSGKSTLLNEMFGTSFKEMDAHKGRSQTTNGVWLARAVGMKPLTVLLDLEGNDGRERGENDTTFEKQIALFSLAVSDIVLINMWCHDIGREQAANKPLLRIVFQVYVTRLLRSCKTTLLFVVRDKSLTPLELLKGTLVEDIQKIWNSVPKPPAHQKSHLYEFFNVEVVALSNRQYEPAKFSEEVAELKQRLFLTVTQDARSAGPASEFSSSCQEFWKDIRVNKDLDIPSHKILVASKRCEEIANDVYSSFVASKEWQEMNEMVRSGSDLFGFGNKLSAITKTCLERYELEAKYFDETVRSSRKRHLSEELLNQLVEPLFQKILTSIKNKAYEEFIEAWKKAVIGKENLGLAATTLTELFMTKFSSKLTEAGIEVGDSEITSVKEELKNNIDNFVSTASLGIPADQGPKQSLNFDNLIGTLVRGVLARYTGVDVIGLLEAPKQ